MAPIATSTKKPASIAEPASSHCNQGRPTPQALSKREIKERTKARIEAYLRLTGDFRRSVTAEQLTTQEMQSRDLARAAAYFKLVGVSGRSVGAEQFKGEIGAKKRAYAEFRRWGAAEQAAEREIEEREQARVETYWKLTGELP